MQQCVSLAWASSEQETDLMKFVGGTYIRRCLLSTGRCMPFEQASALQRLLSLFTALGIQVGQRLAQIVLSAYVRNGMRVGDAHRVPL